MEPSGSQDNGLHGSRRGKRSPAEMKFMFIDSTNHGTNAKPDKTVRSFVMHQARRSKTWSTRQKQPQTLKAEQQSTSRANSRAGEISLGSVGPWQELHSKPSARNAQVLGSPVSNGTSVCTNSTTASQPCTTPASSQNSFCDVPYCTGEAHGHSHLHMASTRRDGFALGVLDPFDCLAVRIDAKGSSLINHFVNIISPRLIPVDIHQSSNVGITQWLANSLRNATSAPFTYTLLTSSSMHLQAFGGSKSGDVLYYKSKAISEINTLLADEKTSTDDSNIASVFVLLCLEESQIAPGMSEEDVAWNQMQRTIHLNGLRTMLQQRGGLSALSSNRCLQVFILMHSIGHAISTFIPPYATLLDSTGQPQKYDIPSFRQRPASSRLLRLFRELKLDYDLYEIISDVVVYTGDISCWFDDKKSPVDPLELQKHTCLLNYRLFDWYHKPVDNPDMNERSPVDQSLCLALMIFLVTISLPYDPSHRPMVLTPVKKLRAALTKGSIFRWAKSQDLLLWTLTIGALAAQGTSESSFFTQYSSVAFADAGFDDKTNADELLDRMRKCLWVPLLLDDEAKKLWVRMGLVKGGRVEEVQDESGILNHDVKDDDIVGLLTSARFFSETTKN